MRCGAKRYLVEVEIDSERLSKHVVARTPAEARKTVQIGRAHV